MIVTIHQPQYLPWLGYFDKAARADIFILLDNVQFKKNEWQNRNKIKTPQGPQWLTVPVLHRFGQNIDEVKINNQVDWREAHLKALKLNYAKSGHFNRYIDFFKKTYERDWENLVDINIFFIEKIIEFLGIKTKIVRSSSYHATDDSTQRLIDLCKKFNATTYASGRDGNKYLDLSKFEQAGIKIVFQNYEHPVYPQGWSQAGEQAFISHLSIVDLLFNCGDKSLEILRNNEALR